MVQEASLCSPSRLSGGEREARGHLASYRWPAPRRKLGRVASVGLLLTVALAACVLVSSPAGSSTAIPTTTISHYEATVDPTTLGAQGSAAGRADAQGLAILDFGRPAVDGSMVGTMDFGDNFISFESIVAATFSYIRGYFLTAPPHLRLDVAIGTNNSCGTGQPCGSIVCGCQFEPPSFVAWGAQQAAAVEEAQSEVSSLRRHSGYSDLVTVIAGDDAEPAFDPGYQNTYDLLAGYAGAVGGFQPAMIDFGSAETGYWSNDQLLQIVDGFKPDVAVPEAYSSSEVASWGSLVSYAKSRGRVLTVFGVLANTAGGYSPEVGYSSLLSTIQPMTGQTAIRWSSDITH
jgi:hypothetical protein